MPRRSRAVAAAAATGPTSAGPSTAEAQTRHTREAFEALEFLFTQLRGQRVVPGAPPLSAFTLNVMLESFAAAERELQAFPAAEARARSFLGQISHRRVYVRLLLASQVPSFVGWEGPVCLVEVQPRTSRSRKAGNTRAVLGYHVNKATLCACNRRTTPRQTSQRKESGGSGSQSLSPQLKRSSFASRWKYSRISSNTEHPTQQCGTYVVRSSGRAC
jgi:hypothetical protein